MVVDRKMAMHFYVLLYHVHVSPGISRILTNPNAVSWGWVHASVYVCVVYYQSSALFYVSASSQHACTRVYAFNNRMNYYNAIPNWFVQIEFSHSTHVEHINAHSRTCNCILSARNILSSRLSSVDHRCGCLIAADKCTSIDDCGRSVIFA